MEITLVNYEYVSLPSRGGLPSSYIRANIEVIANNQEEVRELIQSMERWANNTFEDTKTEEPLIVPPVKQAQIPVEEIDIDPLTGEPR